MRLLVLVRFHLAVAMVAIAASYLSIGVVDPDVTSKMWWLYATVTLILAAVGLYIEWIEKGRKRDS